LSRHARWRAHHLHTAARWLDVHDKIRSSAATKPPVAKRGNLLFVKNGHIFVISVELAERVLERSTYKKTVAEEDELLRQRLTEAVARLNFPKQPASASPAAATAPAK